MRALALFSIFLSFSTTVSAFDDNSASFAEISARANAARLANSLPEAVSLYGQALALSPTWEQGWWSLGSIYYDQNDFPNAVASLAKAVELNPGNAMYLGLLGLSEFESRTYAASLLHVSRSLEIGLSGQDQLEGVLRYHQALLLTHSGEFDTALQKYAWFVQKGVQHSALLMALGGAALHSREFPETVAPGQRELYLAAGKASFLSIAGAKAEAAAAFQDLVQRFPDAPFVHYLRGSFLLAEDRDAAFQEFKEEAKNSPGSAPADAMLAWILGEQEKPSDAAAFAVRAAEEDPALPLAQYVYGDALFHQGHWGAAIEHLGAAVRLQPENVLYHVALAAAYARAGQASEARSEREVSVRLAKEELAKSPQK